MKKIIIFCMLCFAPYLVYADTESTPQNIVIATTAYVQRNINELDTDKQEKLSSDSIVETGNGPIITSVTANNGTVTVTRGEVPIAVGSPESTTYGQMWLQ